MWTFFACDGRGRGAILTGMMRMTSLAMLGALVIGCGLDESGLAPVDDAAVNPLPDGNVGPDGDVLPDGGGGPDASDAGLDVVQPPFDAGPCYTDANACGGAEVPAGWTPVAYAENTQTACPQSYGPADDALINVTTGNGACSCSCTKLTDPTCTTGTIHMKGKFNTCNGDDQGTITFTDGACVATDYFLHADEQATTIQPSGGTCDVAKVQDAGAVIGTDVRLCPPPAECQSATCAGYAPNGFAACIVHDADVPCPNGSSFSQKRLVEKTPTLTCSDCGTACTFKGGCTSPTVHFWSDDTCQNGEDTVAADGKCHGTQQQGQYHGLSYTATASFNGCTATGKSNPSVTYASTRTVCCQ